MSLELRFFGVRIRVHLWFLLMAFALGLSHPAIQDDRVKLLIWILVVFGGVLCHELGHALTGRAFGWTPHIELVALGGVTVFESMDRATPWRRMLMIVNGPLVGIVLGGGAWAFQHVAGPPVGTRFAFGLDSFVFVNLVWGLMNLVPIIPLDGGHLMDELFRLISPSRGRRIACYVSLALTTAAGIVGILFQSPFIVMLTVLLGMQCWRLLRADQQGIPQMAAGAGAREQAYVALARGDGARVVDLSSRVIAEASTRDEADEGFFLLAWGHFLARQPAKAKEAVSSISSDRARDYALEGAIELELGDPDQALVLFEKALPRISPFLESRVVQAIVETRRFDEAQMLFDDELGRGFSPTSLARVQQAACEAGAWQPGLGIGERLYRRTEDGTVAYNNACCATRLGRLDEAKTWLVRAAERGFHRVRSLDEDPDLAPLRALPEWTELRQRFGGSPSSPPQP